MAANPWDLTLPVAGSLMLQELLSRGLVTQDELDRTRPEPGPCFSRVEEMEKIVKIKAEIRQKSLELQMLQLEKETADLAHAFYLGQKLQAIQAMNTHLQRVLKEKQEISQRLAKPQYQENLPIEASCHRSVTELLSMAVNFINKLDFYLQTVKSVPRIPEAACSMDTSLIQMNSLQSEVEAMSELILSWRDEQCEKLQFQA
ncbi:HAUS augmin-like complex subunit 2 [Pelodytes ibericus]